MNEKQRRTILRVLAVLIVLRALTNVFKPFVPGSALVFFGKLLSGVPNVILSEVVGIFMLVYAYGLWQRRRFALPMGIAYAIFVAFNVALFPFVTGITTGGPFGYFFFAVIAVGSTVLAVWLLRQEAAASGRASVPGG